MSRKFYVLITLEDEEFEKELDTFERDVDEVIEESVKEMRQYIKTAWIEENLAT